MQTANVYIAVQSVSVQLVGDFNIRTRNRQVYSSNIKIYRNIDNPIRLIVKNQDLKPVDMASFDVKVDLVDSANQVVVASYTATKINTVKGLCEIIVAAADIVPLESRYHHLMVRKTAYGQDDKVAYVDDNYSVQLPVEIHDSYLPYNPTDLDLGSVADPNEQNFYDLGNIS
jgi:myo-inositol catabolism protein IolC